MAAELAFIALGSNLVEPLNQLRMAAQALETVGEVVRRSSIYETDPVGGPMGQARYLNAVIGLNPCEAYAKPFDLLSELMAIERQQGRERRVRWAARTLDLDLLAYGQHMLETKALSLPHPRMMERAFVLTPLCEIAPNWQHPVMGQNACEALQGLKQEGLKKTLFCW